jgi:hypothetical protein
MDRLQASWKERTERHQQAAHNNGPPTWLLQAKYQRPSTDYPEHGSDEQSELPQFFVGRLP